MMAGDKKRILVVEDEPLIAMDLERIVADGDCEVVGPASTVSQAIATLDGETVDGAIIDMSVGGEMVFPLADALEARHVPFIILSGHERRLLPDRHRHRPFMTKPYGDDRLLDLMHDTFPKRRAG